MTTLRRRLLPVATVALLTTVLLSGVAGAVPRSGGALRPGGPAGLTDYGVVTINDQGAVSSTSGLQPPLVVSGTLVGISASFEGSLVLQLNGTQLDGTGNTIVYAATGGGDGAALTVEANAVTVRDVYTSGDTVGVLADGVQGLQLTSDTLNGTGAAVFVLSSTNLNITGNMLENGGGILLENVSLSIVQTNDLNNSSNGVRLFDGSQDSIVDNRLTNCSTGTGYAVEAENTTGLGVLFNYAPYSSRGIVVGNSTNVSIFGNNASLELHRPLGHGGIGVATDANVQVQENQLVNDSWGLWVVSSEGVDVTRNLITLDHEVGASVTASASVTFEDNVLASNPGLGFEASTVTNLTVLANTISNSEIGIDLFQTWTSTVADNRLSNDPTGLQMYGSSGVRVTDNQIMTSNEGAELFWSENITFDQNVLLGSEVGLATTDLEALSVSGNAIQSPSLFGITITAGDNVSVVRNVVSGSGQSAVQVTGPTGPIVIDSNVLTEADTAAVDVVATTGNVTIQDDNLDGSRGVAVDAQPGAADLAVLGNTFLDAPGGISVTGASGAITVSGNDLGGSTEFGISVQSSRLARLQIRDNNLSDSLGAAVDINNSGASDSGAFVGNNLSGSARVEINDSTFLNGFTDNDLLRVAAINVTNDAFGLVDHNDFDATGFNAAGTTALGWNASYPIGGNYWTTYAGVDRFSGPAQNLPGPDGIGDTPFADAGAVDAYPLMHPWVGAHITFVETGLPAGSAWTVRLDGVTVGSVAGAPIEFSQTNGADTPFAYHVSASPEYKAAPADGGGLEDGTNQTVAVLFSPVLYALTFAEKGVPTGVTWNVTVDGTQYDLTAASTSLSVLNGSYAYTVGHLAGYTVGSPTGVAVVDGGPTTVTFAFTPYTFDVTFGQSGLPTGDVWTLAVGTTSLRSAASNVTLAEPNATYDYAVTPPSGYRVAPSSGVVVVHGANVVVELVFSPVPAAAPALTSTEEGLVGAVVVVGAVAAAGWVVALRGRRGAGGPPPAPPTPSGPEPGGTSPPPTPPSG